MRRSIIDYPAQKGALLSRILSAFILVACLLTAAPAPARAQVRFDGWGPLNHGETSDAPALDILVQGIDSRIYINRSSPEQNLTR
jgi:hypothetical protein